MDDVVLARALHVLAVVIWIGGVSMATTVALPAIRRRDLGEDRLQAFRAIERRFVWQARTAVLIVGAHGPLHDVAARSLGSISLGCVLVDARNGLRVATVRLSSLRRRTVHSAPPLAALGDLAAGSHPLAWLHRVHWVLLALSVVTVLGAVAGSHGSSIF